MSILIGELEFEGPFLQAEDIRPEPGIFGILCQENGEFELIDLGETQCLRDCLDPGEHENNMLFYSETCKGQLSAVVHYTQGMPAKERIALKYRLLSELQDPAPAMA